MPGPFLPGLCRLVASGPISNQERWSNTFHVNLDQPLDQTLADTLATNVEALYNNFEDRLTDSWELDRIQAYDLSAADEPAFECSITGVVGTSTGDAFQQVAPVLTWRTGLPGRKFRGRTFLCGFANDQYVRAGDGPLLFNDATVRGAVLDGAEAYFLAMVADDAIPVVYSRVGAGAQTAIIRADVGSIPDTQRRRRNELVEDYLGRDLP